MGIPGLTASVSHLKKPHPLDFFEDGDIFIDALNFAGSIGYTFERIVRETKEGSKKSTYAQLVRIIAAHLNFFNNLKPHSVTVVFDAFVSEEKFEVRIGRANKQIASRQVRTSANSTILQVIKTRFRHFQVVYSGGEAEDTIMRIIDEGKARGRRRQFVFSQDSDMFRYVVSRPELVEISPLDFKLGKVTRISSINLGAANKIVKRKLRITSIKEPGRTYRTLQPFRRQLYELINCGNVYGRLFRSHGASSAEFLKELSGCRIADCGEFYRRLAYGLLCEKYLQGKNISEVEEWSQVGSRMVMNRVKIVFGTPLLMATKMLTRAEVGVIFETYYLAFCESHDRDMVLAVQVVNHIHDLSARKYLRCAVDGYNEELELQFALARSLLESLSLLSSVLALDPQLSRVRLEFSRQGILAASVKPVPGSLEAALEKLEL